MHLQASFRNFHMVLLREYIAIEIKLIQRDSSSYVKFKYFIFHQLHHVEIHWAY